jgi:hypothetical protein
MDSAELAATLSTVSGYSSFCIDEMKNMYLALSYLGPYSRMEDICFQRMQTALQTNADLNGLTF